MKKLYTLFALLVVLSAAAQPTILPAPQQTKSMLIMNATAHVGNGEVIENSAIGIKDGKIVLAADARLIRLDMSAYDTIIYASGQHVYPGFIAPNSTLGLVEVEAVRATRDFSEVGTFKPSVRSIIAYNTDSEVIPTVRSNGVLMIQVTPRSGIVSGTSSVVQLDAWNWEDAVVKLDDGVHLNWPSMHHKHNDKGKTKIELMKNYDQQLTEIHSFFNEAKAYLQNKTTTEKEIRFEALRGIFEGSQVLYVHADDTKQIGEAIAFKREMKLSKVVIVGGYDSWLMTKELKEENIGVMLPRVHSLPMYNEDEVNLPYQLPARLYKAGVKFCFQNQGDMEAMGTRNLPFLAGTAVTYGLPYEEAIRALTLSAAEMMGCGDTVGSIEVGKDATLFISKGDALDMLTNDVQLALIQGRIIDLTSKQTDLYEKYMKKYGLPLED
ncbi:MAG: amidohydrolase family protein [Flavobacteriales bacterium]|jgi:imidazolonepropionase-like amidohydrolase